MKKKSPLNILTIPVGSTPSGFTLVELLVVISIIGVLAALGLTAMQRVRKGAAETKSASVLRSITQASMNYAADNDGLIPVLRWQGDTALADMPQANKGYVLSSYWGCVQPYLFPSVGVAPANSNAFGAAIKARLPKLFGMPDDSFTTKPLRFGAGSPFEGAVLMSGDWSGIPNPLAFNINIAKWGELKKLQNVDSMSATMYAAYGNGQFGASDGKTYVMTPTNGTASTSRIYYLTSKRAIASFLDGHVDFLTPEIDQKMFTIDDSAP